MTSAPGGQKLMETKILLSHANHVFILYDDSTWDYIE